MFVVLLKFLRSPTTNVVKSYVSDDGVNIGIAGQDQGQEGVDDMDMGALVTVDLGRSTDCRQAKISHNDGGLE